MKNDITYLFCMVDDFYKSYAEALKEQGEKARKSTRVPDVMASGIITIILMFQRVHFRDFKHFYIWVREQYSSEFPKLPGYERFLVLQQRCLPIITHVFIVRRMEEVRRSIVVK